MNTLVLPRIESLFITEIERRCLGAALSYQKMVSQVLTESTLECYTTPAHREIYMVIKSIHNTSGGIDLVGVVEMLKARNSLDRIGGAAFVMELANSISSSLDLTYSLALLRQKLAGRLILETMAKAVNAIQANGDEFEMLELILAKISDIQSTVKVNDFVSGKDISKMLMEYADVQVKINTGKQLTDGVPISMPFINLQKMFGGWQPGALYIVAARPGMGKTAFAVKVMEHAINTGQPVIFFSLEMSAMSLSLRYASLETHTSGNEWRDGKSENDMSALVKFAEKIHSNRDVMIDDSGGITLENIIHRAVKAKEQRFNGRTGIVIIDYLQLIELGKSSSSFGMNREQAVSKISRSLKNLSKEMNCPVIALSQLSRNVESKADKRPELSDLRESGAIEQDADAVIFLYRDEYYGGVPKDEIIVRKNRSGEIGTIYARFNKQLTEWIDTDAMPEPNFANFSVEDNMPF